MKMLSCVCALSTLVLGACSSPSVKITPGQMNITREVIDEEVLQPPDPAPPPVPDLEPVPDASMSIMAPESDTKPPPAGTVLRRRIERSTASSVGPGLSATTPDGKMVQEFSGAPSEISLGDGFRAVGGSFKSSVKIEGTARAGLIILAGFLFVLAAVCAWRRIWIGAGGLAAAGGLCVACYTAPAFAAVFLVAAFIAVAVVVVLIGIRGVKSHEALRAVVGGVASLDPTTQELVKKAVDDQAEGTDEAVIKAVKRADNLK